MIKKSRVRPELVAVRMRSLRGLLLSLRQIESVQRLGKLKDQRQDKR